MAPELYSKIRATVYEAVKDSHVAERILAVVVQDRVLEMFLEPDVEIQCSVMEALEEGDGPEIWLNIGGRDLEFDMTGECVGCGGFVG